jgi:hypothetical protein
MIVSMFKIPGGNGLDAMKLKRRDLATGIRVRDRLQNAYSLSSLCRISEPIPNVRFGQQVVRPGGVVF